MSNVARRAALLLSTACAAVVLAGCATGSRTINQVLADPSRYANRNVTVSGQVAHSVSLLGRGAYRVEDSTGSLWVISDKGVPRKGTRVSVKGKVRSGYDLGTILPLPEAVSNGVVLIENSHKAN